MAETDSPNPASRRRADRHKTEDVTAALGSVVDLSGSGARIRCARRPKVDPGHTMKVTFDYAGGKIQMAAQVRWIRRAGLLKHDVGLKFMNPSPAQSKALEQLAAFGFLMPTANNSTNDQSKPKSKPSAQRRRPKVDAAIVLTEYYKTLGLAPGATEDEIKHTYRKLVLHCHPDVAKSEADIERFNEIVRAYKVLVDHERSKAA